MDAFPNRPNLSRLWLPLTDTDSPRSKGDADERQRSVESRCGAVAAIHARCALVGITLSVRMRQNVFPVDLCRTRRRSASLALPSLSRVTPSAASEHFPELLGCPISASLATCCVRLELRLLPSTGITRLQRYYKPLRRPKASGLSVTGVRLVVPDHTPGLPVLQALSLCTCRRPYPGAATRSTASLIYPVVSAFPDRVVGSACASSFSRIARRSLTLRPAHSRPWAQ